MLDRQPYFKFTFHCVRHAVWRPHPARTPELDRELLMEWLARYPGHPGSDDEARLNPWPERLQLDEQRIMRQLRAWEAIATLDLRAARATGEARADLLYKEAALFYHDPRVLYPAYACIMDFRDIFTHVTWKDYLPEPASFVDFVRTSYSLLCAIRLFERIERERPGYAGLDKVLFSQGLAWNKLLRWLCDAAEGGYGSEDSKPRWTKIRLATAALERCATLFPQSPLTDNALRAAAYWRRTDPEAFRIGIQPFGAARRP